MYAFIQLEEYLIKKGKVKVDKAKKTFRFCKNIMRPSIDPL